MAIVQIPLDAADRYARLQTQLAGTQYTIEYRWNERAGAWFLYLYDADDNPIALGVRVVIEFPLLVRCTDARKPPGMLIAFDTGGKREDVGETDLGSRVVLYHYEPADLVGL